VRLRRLDQRQGSRQRLDREIRYPDPMTQMRMVLLLAAPIFSVAVWGQGTNSAPSVGSAVDSEISLVENEIVAAAEAMPEDKFDFTPERLKLPESDFKGVRTFAWEVKHVAFSNYYLWSPLTGAKIPDKYSDDRVEKMKSKSEIIQYLKDSFALGHQAAGALTAQNMLRTGKDGKTTYLYLATFGAAHALDHYGQIVEYLRMNGIVPPASRVKSD
jgi:hypothetical protein